jgi:hypothetical protein
MATVTHKIGNTTIILHSKSDVILLPPEEQREWFREQEKAGNPAVCRLMETANRILLNHFEKAQQEVGA